MDLVTELYNLRCEQQINEPKYRALTREITDETETLRAQLDSGSVSRFNLLKDMQAEREDALAEASYKQGFKDAIAIIFQGNGALE